LVNKKNFDNDLYTVSITTKCRGAQPSVVQLSSSVIFKHASLFTYFLRKFRILCEFPKRIVVGELVDVG